MAINEEDLKKIAQLAYLNPESEQDSFAEEIDNIINFVEQLKSINTAGIKPFIHSLDLAQPLRPDEITEYDCLVELEEIASQFENGLYLVPKVIDSE